MSILSCILFVLIFGLMAFFIIRFREKESDNILPSVSVKSNILMNKTNEELVIETRKRIEKPARDAFIENIDRFVPLFDNLLDGSYDKTPWTDIIVDINNEDLIEYWKKISERPDAWLNLMAMWGIKHESCSSFMAFDAYNQMYELSNGESMQSKMKYRVLSPCWILTFLDNSGKTEKKVIKKGIVELYI